MASGTVWLILKWLSFPFSTYSWIPSSILFVMERPQHMVLPKPCHGSNRDMDTIMHYQRSVPGLSTIRACSLVFLSQKSNRSPAEMWHKRGNTRIGRNWFGSIKKKKKKQLWHRGCYFHYLFLWQAAVIILPHVPSFQNKKIKPSHKCRKCHIPCSECIFPIKKYFAWCN